MMMVSIVEEAHVLIKGSCNSNAYCERGMDEPKLDWLDKKIRFTAGRAFFYVA